MKSFFAALRFLTPIPVPDSWYGGEAELRRSPLYYPWVGLVIGGVVAAIAFGLDHVLPVLPAGALVVVVMVAASKGLHLDGLADTADGFFSSRSRERILEIMRDSRTGAMGVIAIAAVLIVKVSLLSAVNGPLRWRIILLMPLFGRCALLLVMALFRYARTEGGLASIFQLGTAGGESGLRGATAPAGARAISVSRRWPVLLVLWALVMLFVSGWVAASYLGLASAAAAAAVAVLFGLYCRRKIGGYTGDTLGAACEIVELVPALVAAIWL